MNTPPPVADVPLADINVADPTLYRDNLILPYFERLRREDPVHLHPAHHHENGAFWSVTKYADIMAIETNPQVFSSARGPMIVDPPEDLPLPMFIGMDPPKHTQERKAVSPSVSPSNLKAYEVIIRSRMQATLDALPIGEPFNWVERVSVDLTNQMLATLFDFPWEDRHLLTIWSDVGAADPTSPIFKTNDPHEEKKAILGECLTYFNRLWNERVNAEPRGDLVSMLAHSPSTRNMTQDEYLGNILLLIIGGNDTTRNSMSASVLLMSENPSERAKLDSNPDLLPSMVSETIRWQTPLAHMRRNTLEDVELGGKLIRKGEKVIMWYVSGNRDEDVFERASEYLIDRPKVRQHLSFGFGIHRCMGNRLAELQLRILWEEILERFPTIDVVSPPERVLSSFVRGYERVEVVIPRRL